MHEITTSYYLALLNDLKPEKLEKVIGGNYQMLINEIISDFKRKFKDYIFSSRFIVKPEVTHPLIIMGAAEVATNHHPHAETLIGLPSGSSELVCVVSHAYEKKYERPISTVFFPYSIHSSKQQFHQQSRPDLSKLVDRERSRLKDKHVLLIDDNSSTGRTLQDVSDAVQTASPSSVSIMVAEADIIRSNIDANSNKRTHVAHPDLYKSSIGILPISSRLWPKHDLKEIMDNHQLAADYIQRAETATTMQERVKYEVCAEGLLHPIDQVLENTPAEKRIDNFHGTFLSNFYACPVKYRSQEFPSVEHAYQRAKFDLSKISNLPEDQQFKIREFLRAKGYGKHIADISSMFDDPTITSGTIKVVTDMLRDFGHILPDWDDRRLDTMISLVIQKFQNPELAQRLLETQDNVLIEGNTWNDTFWGVCNGHGRNMLGRILMNVRQKIIDNKLESLPLNEEVISGNSDSVIKQ